MSNRVVKMVDKTEGRVAENATKFNEAAQRTINSLSVLGDKAAMLALAMPKTRYENPNAQRPMSQRKKSKARNAKAKKKGTRR